MKSVAIIIPAKDEEVGLRQLATEFQESPLSKNSQISIIVVLDSRSSDKSREMSEVLATTIIEQTVGHGKGLAVRLAIETWSKKPIKHY